MWRRPTGREPVHRRHDAVGAHLGGRGVGARRHAAATDAAGIERLSGRAYPAPAHPAVTACCPFSTSTTTAFRREVGMGNDRKWPRLPFSRNARPCRTVSDRSSASWDTTVVSVGHIQKLTGTTFVVADSLVSRGVDVGVSSEMTGYAGSRRYRYAAHISLCIGGDSAAERQMWQAKASRQPDWLLDATGPRSLHHSPSKASFPPRPLPSPTTAMSTSEPCEHCWRTTSATAAVASGWPAARA